MNTDRLPEVNNLPNDETIAAMKEVSNGSLKNCGDV